MVNLKHILEQITDLSAYHFRIYDFRDHKYHLIGEYLQRDEEPYTVPFCLVEGEIVLIKYSPETS